MSAVRHRPRRPRPRPVKYALIFDASFGPIDRDVVDSVGEEFEAFLADPSRTTVAMCGVTPVPIRGVVR